MADPDGSSASIAVKQALLTCMDYRIDVARVLEMLHANFRDWWTADPPYVLRNAGAVATDDAVRSLVMVQRLAAAPDVSSLRVAVVGHETCAMRTTTDDSMNGKIETDPETGM